MKRLGGLGGNKKKGKGEGGRGRWVEGEERRKGGGEEEEVSRKMNNRTSFGWTSSKLTLILGSQGKKKCVALKDPL